LNGCYGDADNFSHSITKADGYFIKPRPTFWEYFFLDPSSPLKKFWKSESRFSFLADLTTDLEPEFFKTPEMQAFEATHVEQFDLPMLKSLGAFAALANFFGLSDLHSENLLTGIRDGRFQIAPVDLECAFNRHVDPAFSLLLPSRYVSASTCGYTPLFTGQDADWEPETVVPEVLEGYLDALLFLDQNHETIMDCLASFVTKYNPICRILIRSTGLYQKARQNLGATHQDLLPSEREQLERGDIPY
jgi:hypothetical protein